MKLIGQDQQQANTLPQQFSLSLQQNVAQSVHKLVIYCHSAGTDENTFSQQALTLLDAAKQQGFTALLTTHQNWCDWYS